MNDANNSVISGSSASLPSDVKRAFEAPQWYFSKLNYRIRLRQKFVREVAAGISFDQIIDLGCGDGSISLPLLNEKRKLTLQDLSEAMLERARAQLPPQLLSNVELVVGDIRDSSIAPNSYDIAICLGVLSYIDNIRPFVERIGNLVKPGGNLLIECSDGEHFIYRLLSLYSTAVGFFRRPSVSIRMFSHPRAQVARLLIEFGFALVDEYRYSMPPPLMRNLVGQTFHYRANRFIHGELKRKRFQCLGTECILHFRRVL